MNLNYILGFALLAFLIWSIIELIGLHIFNLRFYKFGVKVFQKEIAYKHINWEYLDDIYSEDLARYIFISRYKTGYFVSKLSFFKYHSPLASTKGIPLTIFGKIENLDHKIKVSFYLSYRIIAVLIFLMAIPLGLAITQLSLISLFITLAFGGVIFIAIKIVSVFQQGKMLTMTDEIKSILHIN